MPDPTPRARTRLRERILAWYRADPRDLPWRRTRDPYAVLVSEIMLQQTQATRVADRYVRFMARFPTAEVLAAASPSAVLAEWNGLGYNRRAVALQRAATAVARGGWPRTVPELQTLPGVGPYTARALASLAFGHPVAGVDTNVRRWLVRRLAARDRPSDLQAAADGLAAPARDAEEAGAWMHASMEFGARICTARAPRCADCPVARGCPSRSNAPRMKVARQAPYAGSARAQRGALLRRLAEARDHAVDVMEARSTLGPAVDDVRFQQLLTGLERDDLVQRHGRRLRLGAGTIGR